MSRRWLTAAVLLVAASAAAPAAARSDDEEPEVGHGSAHAGAGFDLGIRTGYAIPFGNGSSQYSPAHQMYGDVPLILETAARLNNRLAIGLMFQYGFGQLRSPRSNGCGTNGLSCSASSTHLALEAIFHPTPNSGFAPWLGVGTGYEWVDLEVAMTGTPASAGTHGFEFLILQVGGDIRVASWFAVGPFVMFSLGWYGGQTVTIDHGYPTPADGTDTHLHEWLTFGIRGNLSS